MVLMHEDKMIAGLVSKQDSVSVTGDGEKTYGELLDELYSKIDVNKLTIYSRLLLDAEINEYDTLGSYLFSSTRYINSSTTRISQISIKSSGSRYKVFNITTSGVTEVSADTNISTRDTKFTLYY